MIQKKDNKKLYMVLCVIIVILLALLLIKGCDNYENINNDVLRNIIERIKNNGTKIEQKSMSERNGAKELKSPKIKKDKMSFSFVLPNANSELEYTFKVKNNSDVSKILKEIKSNNPNVTLKVKNISDSVIKGNTEKEITIIFKPKNGGSNEEINVDVQLVLEEKTNSKTDKSNFNKSNDNKNTNESNKNNNTKTNTNNTNSTNVSTNTNTNAGTSSNTNNNSKGNSNTSTNNTSTITKYTVELIDNGNVVSLRQYEEGSTISTIKVSKTGYTFLYWSTQPNGTKYDLSQKLTGNLRLYSVYKINTYTIEITDENGNKVEVEKNYGETLTDKDLPKVEEKEGYTAVWYIKGTDEVYDITKGIDENIELELRYERIKNEVVFNDENRLTKIKVEYNSKIYPIASKGKEGYTFSHWAEVKNGLEYDFETEIKKAFTLYAVYTPNKYTITIVDSDGKTITKEVDYDSTYGTLPTPEEKEGYDFIGYYNEDGEEITSDTKVDVSKDQVIIPKYQKKKYTVTYNYGANGGDSVSKSTKEVEYEGNVDLSVLATKADYEFVGWSLSSDNIETLSSLKMDTENITLYAIYKRENKVVFKANGNVLESGSSIIPGSSEIELKCLVYNNDKSCYITTPLITSENTPIIIGYSSSKNSHESLVSHNETILIDKDGYQGKNTLWAQSKIEKVTYTSTYIKGDGVDEIGKEEDSCTISETYNGEKQPTTCDIKLPSITLKDGYNSPKWYESSNIYNPSSTITLTSSKEFEARGVAGVYILTIKDSNGNVIETKEITKDEVYGELPTPEEKEGYTFKGYYDSNGNEITPDTKVDVTSDLELIAKYEKNKYKVTYNYETNGGDSAEVEEKEVSYKDDIDLSVKATKADYEFIGWSLESDNTSVLEKLKMGANNVTLYAIYKRENKVVFNANNNKLTIDDNDFIGNESVEVSCYAYNNSDECNITVPSVSSEVTTLVIGYSDTENKHEKQIESAQTITINKNGYNNKNIYYGQTYSDEINYTVTYDKELSISSIGKENDNCTINKVYNGQVQNTECEITLPDFTEETGYENGKWYDDTSSFNKNVSISISKNKLFTAKADIKTYTVIFKDYADNELSHENVNHGSSVLRPNDTERTYYDFKYWSTSKDGEEYDFTSPVTSNLTLYAVYEVKHYTVTINNDGNEYQESVEAGSLISNVLPETSKTGYDFKHWAYSNDEEVEDTAIVDRDLTVHTVYEIHTYVIKFYEDEKLLNEIGKVYESKLTEEDLPDASKEGYTYNWYQLNASDPYDLNRDITSDLTLYVKYTKIVNGVTFVVGLNETIVEVEYGNKVQEEDIPDTTKTGYTFTHWSEEENGEEAFNLDTEIKKVTKVYAVYTPIVSTVTFKDENDSVISTKEVSYDSEFGELPDVPIKEGYTPIGWYIGDDKIESNTKVSLVENTDIKPKYSINSYTVTYNYAENGGVSASKSEEEVNFNESIDLEVEATKNNYIFVGWNTDKDATTKLETLTMGTENITLYAIYKIVNKVSFNANNNKLTLNTGEVSGENDYEVSCEAFNKEETCDITIPTISNDITPNVIGYSEEKNKHENKLSSGSTITIDSNGYNDINKYYAQTYKDSITYEVNYTKEDSIQEISKTSDSCTIDEVYNGSAQSTECEITLPNITEVEGYENGKWFDDNTSYEETAKLNISSNSSYVAKATIKSYTVTFKDYDDKELSSQTINHGSLITMPTDSSRKYYDFKWWSTSKDGTAYNFETPVTENVTLYAVYEIHKYTVTFISDGNVQSSNSVDAGTAIDFEDSSKTGYDFKYWSDEENGEETTKTIVEDDVTLYAVFEKHKYTVTFNDENETKIKDVKVKYQETIISSDVPETEKEGYSFDGWFKKNSDVAFDLTSQITEDVSLYKKYTRVTKGVTFDDEGRTTLVTVNYGDTVSPIESQGKTGYTFTCWSETKDCSNEFDFTTQIKGVKTIYAVYTPITSTVTFKNEAGEVVSTKSVTYDSTYGTLPEVPAKTGYTPNGWYIGNDKIESNTKVTILENTDITPKYTINNYKLTINYDNGTTNLEETLDYNETYNLTVPTKQGYTFNGWEVTGQGSSETNNVFTMGYEDTTVKALYTANTYKITLDNNSATTTGTTELYENYNNGFYLENTLQTKVTSITKPTKTGYTFKGYYDSTEEIIDENGNIKITNTKYTEDKTLTASWTINSYSLTINRNNGTSSEVVSLNYNATKEIANPSKDGYTFTSWTLTGSNSSMENGTFTMGTENATLDANYTKNSYQVKYDGNNATSGSMSNSTHTYDESKKLTKNAYTRNGYTFIGWNTNKNATTALYTDEKEVSNLSKVHNDVVTLYAIWSINSYTLTVKPNTGSYDGKTTDTVYNNVQYSSTKTILNASKTGYDFVNWRVDGTGSSISGTTFTMGYQDATLTANYTPHIYTITLDQTGTTTNGTTTMYLKYNTGYYLDSAATKQMSTSANDIVVPEKYGYVFNGYYTGQNGTGTQVINNQGYFTGNITNTQYSQNITLYASYTQITASMLKYTDTYNMGCTNAGCALDKLYELFN